MAKKWAEVYDDFITEKNTMANLNTLQPNIDSAQTLLTDLTSSSKVAKWRLYFAVVSTGIVTLYNWVEIAMATIYAALKAQKVGNVAWYRTISLQFQYGDALTFVNGDYVYATINPANQIIKQCAAVDGNPLLLKVVTSSGGGYGPLNPSQLTAFTTYINQRKFAGTGITIFSLNPDELALDLKIYYNPLLMDNTGQSLAAPGTYPVEVALDSYLKDFATTNFNGRLILTKLVDALQLLPEVTDPILLAAAARIGVNPFVAFAESYNSAAGYMILNLANTTITYLPDNV